MLIGKLLDPKIDYVFKRIFGHVGNEDITKNLLSSITKEEITEIKLDCNPITEKDLFNEKVGILDIKAKINNSINCDIEMQIINKKNIEKRILYYWSKMYTKSIKEGEDYSKLEKGIVILITNYDIDKLKGIKKYITKWNIRKEENAKVILTEDLELYILELRKVNEKTTTSMLEKWLKFINNPKEVSEMENKEIKKAREELEKISEDEHEQYLAELREKYIMDQKAIEDAGYDKGVIKGIKQRNIEIAKILKQENTSVELIIKATGLTAEEIEKL